MSKKKIEKIITETSAEAYMINNITPKLEAMKEDISLTRTDQKTCTEAVLSSTEAMVNAFNEMKEQKRTGPTIEVYGKGEVARNISQEVKTAFKSAMDGVNLNARIPSEDIEKLTEATQSIKEAVKRPPLLSLSLNLPAKILAVILLIEILVGAGVYLWFVNTPMYLGNELYQSHCRMNHSDPGSAYHWAYQMSAAGFRKKVKAQIGLSHLNEKEHIAYSDTLSRALSHPGIYISDIMRDKQEQLVSFVDSTGTVRSAHFRKDGSLRITEDQRILTLEDTRRIKGVKWTSVQKQ
jgi:hypothetical protein